MESNNTIQALARRQADALAGAEAAGSMPARVLSTHKCCHAEDQSVPQPTPRGRDYVVHRGAGEFGRAVRLGAEPIY